MDVLNRLTNKDELEKRVAERDRTLTLVDAGEIERFLKAHVIGQDSVCEAVAVQIRRRLAARRRDKPIAVFCFAGPPGVGKSYFGKVLAKKLYGDEKFLQFFDMSQFDQPHAAASLFGQAKGYVGSNSYGTLTATVRDFPDSVILLDEFEKAHPDVRKRFLTAWNDGFVTEVSDGAKLATSGIIFILTTNAGTKQLPEIYRRYGSDQTELSRALRVVLEEAQFAPEVLSRIDNIFAFMPLEGLDVARVVALEIERIVCQYDLQLADNGIDPEILLDAIAADDPRRQGGVRELTRLIENQITDALIDAKAAGGGRITLAKAAAGGVVATLVSEPDSLGQGG